MNLYLLLDKIVPLGTFVNENGNLILIQEEINEAPIKAHLYACTLVLSKEELN